MKFRIKEIRKNKKMTQENLADLVGMSQPQIQRIETGQSSLTLEQIDMFAKALQVEPYELFPEEWRPKENVQETSDAIDDNLLLKIVNRINELEEENGYEFSAADKNKLVKLIYLKLKEMPQNDVLSKTAEIVSIYDFIKKAN